MTNLGPSGGSKDPLGPLLGCAYVTLTGIGLNSYYYNMIAFKTNILFPSLMLGRQSITLTGSACDFVDFGAASSSGSGCEDGTKMVLKSA